MLDNVPLLKLVGGSLAARLHTVVSHDTIGRLMLACARQPGLAYVFEDLLGFEGSEIYRKCWGKALEGVAFGDVALHFPDAIPIGIVANGAHRLRPPNDYLIAADDELLVLAEDNDSYSPIVPPQLAPAPDGALAPCPPAVPSHSEPERLLFVGWRRDLQDLILAVDEARSRPFPSQCLLLLLLTPHYAILIPYLPPTPTPSLCAPARRCGSSVPSRKPSARRC